MNTHFKDTYGRDFTWEQLGDIPLGRGSLGQEVPVVLYRLMQYSLLDVLGKDFGNVMANHYLRRAGYIAGSEFAKNMLDVTLDFNSFVSHLQEQLKILKVGILRVESVEDDGDEMVLTIEEDLDCSGLPVTGDAVCTYDEGFLAGVLGIYTGKKYIVTEIDCWATGDRICRFKAVAV